MTEQEIKMSLRDMKDNEGPGEDLIQEMLVERSNSKTMGKPNNCHYTQEGRQHSYLKLGTN